MSEHQQKVDGGREFVKNAFNRLIREYKLTVEAPEWEDRRRGQPDPLTNYRFCFGLKGNVEYIDFVVRELTDFQTHEPTRHQIESKIRQKIESLITPQQT